MSDNGKTNWDLAPAPESTSHAQIKSEYGLFIDGKFVNSSGDRFDTINPATEAPLAKITEASKSDVNKAIKAARVAYEKVWSKMPALQRGKYIYRIARMIQERACLLYTSPSPRDQRGSRMPSSA